MQPVVATPDRDLWLISNAVGQTRVFWEAWPEWVRLKVPATECPRIRKREGLGQRRARGARAQETARSAAR